MPCGLGPEHAAQVYSAGQTILHVQHADDRPVMTASRKHFVTKVGGGVPLEGVELDDADAAVEGSKWMTLMVAASSGKLYVDEDCWWRACVFECMEMMWNIDCFSATRRLNLMFDTRRSERKSVVVVRQRSSFVIFRRKCPMPRPAIFPQIFNSSGI